MIQFASMVRIKVHNFRETLITILLPARFYTSFLEAHPLLDAASIPLLYEHGCAIISHLILNDKVYGSQTMCHFVVYRLWIVAGFRNVTPMFC